MYEVFAKNFVLEDMHLLFWIPGFFHGVIVSLTSPILWAPDLAILAWKSTCPPCLPSKECQ